MAVQREFAVGDAVAVAADEGAEGRLIGNVAVELVVAQDDVGELAALVRNFQRLNYAAEVADFDFHAVLVSQLIKLDVLPIRHSAKLLRSNSRFCQGRRNH